MIKVSYPLCFCQYLMSMSLRMVKSQWSLFSTRRENKEVNCLNKNLVCFSNTELHLRSDALNNAATYIMFRSSFQGCPVIMRKKCLLKNFVTCCISTNILILIFYLMRYILSLLLFFNQLPKFIWFQNFFPFLLTEFQHLSIFHR